MSKDKKVEIITRAIKEFFFLFPQCLEDDDLDQFMISKHDKVYRVELRFDGKSYIHFMAE